MTPSRWAGLGLPRRIRLRPASAETTRFAQELYVATMRPLLQRFDAWQDEAMLAHFRGGYVPEQVRVIEVDGVDSGYVQVLEGADALTILQLHLLPKARRRGTGSALIRAVLAYARRRRKPVLLSVVRHNPAIALYRRLGFEVASEDRLRLHMRWQQVRPAQAPDLIPAAELEAQPAARRPTRRSPPGS